jgi:hypothetical protein
MDSAASQLREFGRGTYQEIGTVPAVFELPRFPKGLVFLAHGCHHSAGDFWSYSASCPMCIGLPEELRITSAIVAAGWAAIALSSADRGSSRCWDFETDGARVVPALTEFRKSNNLSHLPLAALGVSSGGAFVLQLAKAIPLHAVVSQIMAIPPSYLVGYRGAPFPPTLFIHMPRDKRTGAGVRRCLRHLNETGVRAAELRAPPIPIHPSFFCRVPGVDEPLSHKLRRSLAPMLDSDGWLREDPRGSSWRELVRAVPEVASRLPGTRPGVADSLEADVSPLSEVLNVAWAVHEITGDYMRDTMEWIGGAKEGAAAARRWGGVGWCDGATCDTC